MAHSTCWDLILGSSSPRRIELLTGLKVNFRIIKPDVLEQRGIGEMAEPYTARNARLKADRVLEMATPALPNSTSLIISADTIVVCGQNILEKPIDPNDAKRMLRLLAGRDHRVLTGLCILQARGGKLKYFEDVIETTVTLKPLRQDEIDAYVATGEPMDKSGSYAIQGMGGYMVSRINGSYSNVVGLPMAELSTALSQEFSFDLWKRSEM